MKKGPWNRIEDSILIEYLEQHGEGSWYKVHNNTGLARSGKSCRLRWTNHLRPNLKKGSFSPDEQDMIIYMHSKIGNKLSRIASMLPGRTDNEIKNFWNTRTKRCLKDGTPLYPPSLQPIDVPPPSSSLSSPDPFLNLPLHNNSTSFPHLSTAQLAANLEGLLSTLGSPLPSLPSLSIIGSPLESLPLPNACVTDVCPSQIPPPAPPSPASTIALNYYYQVAPLLPPQDNGLLEDLLGQAPALPHTEDSTIPSDLSNHKDGSLSPPLSIGVNTPTGEDHDLSGLLDNFSPEMPMLDWYGREGQSLELRVYQALCLALLLRNFLGILQIAITTYLEYARLLLQYLQRESPGYSLYMYGLECKVKD